MIGKRNNVLSVFVAASISFATLSFTALFVAEISKFGSYLPLPRETTHWSDSSGHSSLASDTAIAVGLLASSPPS